MVIESLLICPIAKESRLAIWVSTPDWSIFGAKVPFRPAPLLGIISLSQMKTEALSLYGHFLITP